MSIEPIMRVVSSDTCRHRAYEGLIAQSPAMRELVALVERVAPTDLPIVIAGETGTGKDVIARLIHARSQRRGPLVAFNCAAVPTALAESELFGHLRGAFTGADTTHAGLFEQADGGSLFLDEVGELDLAIQAKLLRVIEDGLVRPVGGASTRAICVRVIAASHRDLSELAAAKQFRADLYHRIAGILLSVPPLRVRHQAIPPLTLKFLAQAAPERPPRITLEASEWLREQPWPGNVRELRQTIHRAVALGGDQLTIEDFTRLAPRRLADPPIDQWFVGKSWRELEVEILRWALERHGTVRAAARALGRAPSTLAERVHRLGLKAPATR